MMIVAVAAKVSNGRENLKEWIEGQEIVNLFLHQISVHTLTGLGPL